MFKTKLITTFLLVLAVLFAQVGTALAAPKAQEVTPLSGMIQSITTETDSAGTVTVLVTLTDDQGTTQTVRLSAETATFLELVTLDTTTNEYVVNDSMINQTVTIDPTTVIPDTTQEEVSYNPISELLAVFFGQDASVIDGYHDDGYGFGMIAQALWMSKKLNGDANLAGAILEAKKTGDYSAFTLPDGSSPTNWGQFKKAVSDKKHNLGVVVSGHADNSEDSTQPGNGNGHGNQNNNGNNGKNK